MYLTTAVKYPLSSSLFCSCIGLIIFGSLSPLVGHIADKIGERKVMLSSCFITMFFSPLIFYLLQQQRIFPILTAIFISAVMMSTFNSPTNALLQRLFPTKVRYTGIALGYAIGIALLGGTHPFLCTYFVEITQNAFAPSLCLIFASLVGMVSLHFSRRATDFFGFSQITPEYSLPSKARS